MQSSKKPSSSDSVRERIFIEVLRDLENQRIVPGQRLAETDLVSRFGVSRNAVREGIQLLAGQGIVDLSPNKSPTIRRLTLEEALGVLDISELLTGLLVRSAAENYDRSSADQFAQAKAEVDAVSIYAEKDFARAQRHFVREMLRFCGNKELQRIYPMVGMAVFMAQFRSPELLEMLKADLQKIYAAVTSNDTIAAERIGRDTIRKQREVVRQFFA